MQNLSPKNRIFNDTIKKLYRIKDTACADYYDNSDFITTPQF